MKNKVISSFDEQQKITNGESIVDALSKQYEIPLITPEEYTTTFSGGFKSGLSQVYNFLLDEPKLPVTETKGFKAGAGEFVSDLLNPVNIGIAVATGGASEAIASSLSGASKIAGIAGTEFAGGMGFTLADHYKKKFNNLNDDLTASNFLATSALGGALGFSIHSITGTFNKEFKDLYNFFKNKDINANTDALNINKQYNNQNNSAYNLNFEAIKPTSPIKINNQINTEETINKIGIEPTNKIINEDEEYINRAKDLYNNNIKLSEAPDRILSVKNELDAKFSQILNDAPQDVVNHLFNPSKELLIRKAIKGEVDGLDELSINAGKLYNSIDKELIDIANRNNIDVGYIDGYIRQVHDIDRMRIAGKDEWVKYIQPRLANEVSSDVLRNTYDKLLLKNIDENFISLNTNPLKERVYEFKDAVSQLEYENEFGYKKLIGSHLVDNINALSDKIALQSLIGTDSPQKVLKYLGKIENLSDIEIDNVLSNIQYNRVHNIDNLLTKSIKSVLTASRLFNAIFKPAYVFLHLPNDFVTASIQALSKFGISNTVKGIFSKSPINDIKYLANLPFEKKETWKNILGEFKQEARLEHFEILGAKIPDKTSKVLKLSQRAYLKIGGMHMLDNMVRKYSLKIASTAIREEFKTNGLKNLLPNSDVNILKMAIDRDGNLNPSLLDNIAKNTKDKIQEKNIIDTSNKLKYLYSKTINDVNPIYSNKFAQLNKFDPAITAGARSMLWAIRMYSATYGDLLKQLIYGQNKIRAGATLIGSALGLTAIDIAVNHIINGITGKKEHISTGINILDKTLKDTIDNDFNREYATNLFKNLTLFSTIYTAPIWYGSGANAFRAGIHELSGNPDKAKEDIKKAIPLVGALTNIWSNYNE